MLPVPEPFRPVWSAGWEKKLAASQASASSGEPVMEMVMGRMVEVAPEEEAAEVRPPLQLRPLVSLVRAVYKEKMAFDDLSDEQVLVTHSPTRALSRRVHANTKGSRAINPLVTHKKQTKNARPRRLTTRYPTARPQHEAHEPLAKVTYRMFGKKYGSTKLAEERLQTLFHSLMEHQVEGGGCPSTGTHVHVVCAQPDSRACFFPLVPPFLSLLCFEHRACLAD